MSGINQSKVSVTLRNPLVRDDQITYDIIVNDTQMAKDWVEALKQILQNDNLLEKNFCFLGFPNTQRDMEYLSDELTQAVDTINQYFDDYEITETYTPETLRNGLDPNQDLMNKLHNHFEVLQGTVENLSDYYRRADYETKYAIRQLNIICHELESLMLSLRKKVNAPDWVRGSQITTFLQCERFLLTDEHRQGFLTNGYDREFGGVYMHWTQIGKTLFEVFNDEGAPKLTASVCEAITHLQYYSGEFDVEWGNTVNRGDSTVPWHNQTQDEFEAWLRDNKLDPKDIELSLGYLPLGKIDLTTFGTDDPIEIREQLGRYLDVYKIEVDGVSNTFEYCWTDSDYKQQQINRMIPGYDFSSRG